VHNWLTMTQIMLGLTCHQVLLVLVDYEYPLRAAADDDKSEHATMSAPTERCDSSVWGRAACMELPCPHALLFCAFHVLNLCWTLRPKDPQEEDLARAEVPAATGSAEGARSEPYVVWQRPALSLHKQPVSSSAPFSCSAERESAV